ncbi:MAG: hypothetical protein AB1641_07110 [Thermodesulfobacteriota bacterium]
MNKAIRFALIVLCIICLQLIVGITVIKPLIFTWGSTDQEITMSMPGDHLAPFISSTRSVTISAPISEVWDWLIQLGSDRGGFYSYWFIERPLGYKFRAQNRIEPEFKDMKVGRIIRTSLDPSKSVIEYNFPVVAVDPGKSYVLKGWGCFLLNEIDSKQTRLIVRTHGQPLSSLGDHLEYFIMMPLHYLMERRMLMGIKARAEAGPGMEFSSTYDIMWLTGICLSLISTIGLLIIDRQLKVTLLAILYSILWLWILFILDPIPTYSMILFMVLMINLGWLFKTRTSTPE